MIEPNGTATTLDVVGARRWSAGIRDRHPTAGYHGDSRIAAGMGGLRRRRLAAAGTPTAMASGDLGPGGRLVSRW